MFTILLNFGNNKIYFLFLRISQSSDRGKEKKQIIIQNNKYYNRLCKNCIGREDR